MDERNGYEQDGFILERGLVPRVVTERLVEIGERVHARWMEAHGDEARRSDLVNSTGLTAGRYFRPPFQSQRAIWFDALADDVLSRLVTRVFGDDLYFHGTQMFFNPVAGSRRPYWRIPSMKEACGATRRISGVVEPCPESRREHGRPQAGTRAVYAPAAGRRAIGGGAIETQGPIRRWS